MFNLSGGRNINQHSKKVKVVILEAIMLEYPKPNWQFDIYLDASSMYAMGAVLEQDGKIVSTF
jgi:hypothetical protein